MSQLSSSKPNASTLKHALKLQEQAQQLIRNGYSGAPVNTKAGRAVIAWTMTRQRFAERVPTNLVDGQILLHFAMQALGAIPNAVNNGTPAEAQVLAAEANTAIVSLATFIEQSTGQSPRDLGLFPNFFPEALH